jgi:hypothetical protein
VAFATLALVCVAPSLAQAHTASFPVQHALTIVSAVGSDQFSGHLSSAELDCVRNRSGGC